MILITVTSRVAVLQREYLTGAGGYEAAFMIAEKVAVSSPVRVGMICPQVIVLSAYCDARDLAARHRIQSDTPESF